MGGCDPRDQIERYMRWWLRGENSVTGRCFDIGNATRGALQRYRDTGDPFAGDPSPNAAGNGSLMRLAPVALAAASEAQAIEWAALQSRTTHATRECLDACRLYAVNLGQDTDTTGAIFGQLAGAHYGLEGIPAEWRQTVLWADQILALALALLAVGRDGA